MQAVEDRLRAARPELDAAELDDLKRRVLARATERPRSLRRLALPRIATTALLVAGFVVTGGSAGLAVSGISGSGSAGSAQYPRTDTTPNLGGVGGDTTDNPGTGQGSPGDTPTDDSGNAVVEETSPETTQTARQIGSDDSDRLPFTGLAAIPLLLVGGVLLAAGAMLRRPSRLHRH